MRLKLHVLVLILFQVFSLAAHGLTVSAVLGMGSSQTKNEIAEQEGPFSQAYTIEKMQSSNSSIGIEHLRSFSSKLVSSISYTGVIYRYYLNAAPVGYFKPEELDTGRISYRDFSIFTGAGAGFTQSSRLPDPSGLSSNAAGIYLSPRVGVDYQLTGRLGVRSELLIAMSLVGKGQISTFSVGAGIYYFF